MVKDRTMPTKAVVVTGASTGIGQSCALYLDRLGFMVFAGVRKQADADTLQQKGSERLSPVFIDVTKADTIASAVQTVAAVVKEVGLVGLINNAGVAIGGPLEFVPIAELRTQLEVNVVGQIAVTQAFLPLLRQGQGRVINMSSISGRVAMPFMGPYAGSKFALEALTDSLRVELKPWGIKVVSIQPGAIVTPIWEKSVTRAEQLLNKFPVEADSLYGPPLAALRRAVLKTGQNGILAVEVAKVVAQALTAKRPKTRYLVGRDAKMAAVLVKLIPDRLRDWLILTRI